MCGDSSRESEGGALAVLNLSQEAARYAPKPRVPIAAGRLVFHELSRGGLRVTHAALAMDKAVSNLTEGTTLTVGIHETGDLTTSAIISPFMFKFNVAKAASRQDDLSSGIMEAELCQPLMVCVGGDGIIGRRVTIWTPNATVPVAEGIVGYN